MKPTLKTDAKLIVTGQHKVTPDDIEPPEFKMCLPDKHISVEQLEAAIDQELAADEHHRQQRTMAAMRAGALFYCLKKAMEVSGKKYTGFWEHCEKRFGVNRATVSRKMRLCANWAAKNGAKAELISELAEAATLEPSKDAPKAVQLAFEWIGDLDLSDLYRREKLVNYGPQNTGKLLGDPKLKRRLPDSEHGLEQQQKWVAEQWREPGFTRKELLRWLAPDLKTKVKPYLLLTDAELNEFASLLHDLHREICDARVGRGALKRKSL